MGSGATDDAASIGIYSHAEAYTTFPGTELAAICDVDAMRLRACGERWKVAARYASLSEMLATEQPEIVSICTPDETHAEVTTAVLEAPETRAVLLEKPLAMTLEDARGLVEMAKARGVSLAVNYSRRYAASHWELRNALRAGAIGRLQSVSGFYTKGVVHNGTHWFDLARFLCGEIAVVRGFGRADTASDPELGVHLTFESGATGYLHSCDAQAFAIFEMDLIGTSGRIRIVDSGHEFETFAVEESPHYAGYRSLRKAPGLAGGLRDVTLRAVEDLVECLERGGRQPRCSAADALAALEIALSAADSASTGQPVEIASFVV